MRVADRHNILQAVQRLSEVLGVSNNAVGVSYEPRLGRSRIVAAVDSGSLQFAILWKAS